MEEAFGRVAIEGGAFGIPVIVSNRGGLSETVPSEEFVITDFMNIGEWISRIKKILGEGDSNKEKFIGFVKKFDSGRIVDKLLENIC